jgi:hypothetical protein
VHLPGGGILGRALRIVVHQRVEDGPGGGVRVPEEETAQDCDTGVDGAGRRPVGDFGLIVSCL